MPETEKTSASPSLVSEDLQYLILSIFEERPDISQRKLAGHLGISVGKANHHVRTLVEEGCIDVKNYINSNHKVTYSYHLTPDGLEEKARLAIRCLKRKMAEYDALRVEIERLKRNVSTC